MRIQIIIEGEEFIKAFYEKTKLNVETNKNTNREKEKVCVFILKNEDHHLIYTNIQLQSLP